MSSLLKMAFFFILILGCRSVQSKEGMLTDESFDNTQTFEETTDSIPPALWLPEQKKANAGHYFMVAEYTMMNGDFVNAMPLYEMAYTLDPNEFLAGKLIAARLVNNQTEDLLIEARKMVLLYPKSANLHSLYGQILIEKKLFADAIKEFKYAIKIDPSNELYYRPLITLLQQDEKTDESISYALQLIKESPSSLVGWSFLSRLYIIKGDYKQALKPAKISYELQQVNPELVLIYAYVLELNGKTKEAVRMYEKLYRLNPTNENLINRMLALYRETGGLEEALNMLNEMADSPDGDSPSVHIQRAYILWDLKRDKEAAEILINLENEHGQDQRIKYLVGLAYEKIENLDNALKIYDEITEISEFKKHANIRSVVIYQQKKNYQAAIDKIDYMIEHEEKDQAYFLIKSNLYSEQEDFRSAISTLEKGIKTFPDSAQLYFQKGVNEEKAKDMNACISSMRKVVELDPQHSSAFNYLGYIYAESGENLDEAEQLIKRALEIKPGDAYYLDSLGWVYYQKKEYKKAQDVLLEAFTHLPKEPIILEHLGDVYAKLKEIVKAKQFYNTAIENSEDAKEKDRLKKKSENLAATN